jgi:hypothetical protein
MRWAHAELKQAQNAESAGETRRQKVIDGEPHRRTVHDLTQAQVLTQEIEPAALLADKGDESDDFMANLEVRINPSFRRRQMTRRRASARLRSIASGTSSILPEIK